MLFNHSKENINEFQYLFLGGICGEILEPNFVGNYLFENKKMFEMAGVQDITCKTLSTYNCADTNSNILIKLIEEIHLKHNKKIILFAHSKGTLETILTLGKHSKSFLSKIHKAILTQPPLNGVPYIPKAFKKIFKPLMPGVHCLTENNYKDQLNEILLERSDLRDFVTKKLLVIKGHKSEFLDVSWTLKIPYLVNKLTKRKTDGLLSIEDQTFHTEDYHNITLNIDHSDLFCSSKVSNISNHTRKRIFSSLMDWAINQKKISVSDMPKNVQYRIDKNSPRLLNKITRELTV
jgi:hypothetical protein